MSKIRLRQGAATIGTWETPSMRAAITTTGMPDDRTRSTSSRAASVRFDSRMASTRRSISRWMSATYRSMLSRALATRTLYPRSSAPVSTPSSESSTVGFRSWW